MFVVETFVTIMILISRLQVFILWDGKLLDLSLVQFLLFWCKALGGVGVLLNLAILDVEPTDSKNVRDIQNDL